MTNKITNVISFLFVAAAFALIGHEVGHHKGMTHSGTQANCPIHSSIHPDCQK